MKTVRIWMWGSRGIAHLLPVTPEIISVENTNKIVRTELLSVGEISQLGGRQLKQISFTSFFPEFPESYSSTIATLGSMTKTVETIVHGTTRRTQVTVPVWEHTANEDSPATWVQRIQELMTEKIFLAITHPPIVGDYYINDFQHSLVGGEGADITYSLTLIEARSSSIRSVDFDSSLGEPVSQLTFAPYTKGDKTYIVRSNPNNESGVDELQDIALKAGRSVWALKHYNNIVDSSVPLREGGVIYLVPTTPGAPTQRGIPHKYSYPKHAPAPKTYGE